MTAEPAGSQQPATLRSNGREADYISMPHLWVQQVEAVNEQAACRRQRELLPLGGCRLLLRRRVRGGEER